MKSLLAGAVRLTDSELRSHLKRAAKNEREATASLIAYLAVFDKRKLYLDEGCASMFQYCVTVLHLSEPAACQRIQAIRSVRRCSSILTNLSTGELTLSNLRLIAPLLNRENADELLGMVRYKSKREVEQLAANMRPQPDAPTSIRKAPQARAKPPSGGGPDNASSRVANDQAFVGDVETNSSHESSTVERDSLEGAVPAPANDFVLSAPPRPVITPLGLDRFKIQFTAGVEMHDRLRRAQTLLLPVIPDGDVAAVVDRALTLLLKHLERTRRGTTDRPRPSGVPRPYSRHIPASLKRQVFERDGERCTEIVFDGQRCRATDRLVIDHIVPFGDGGKTALENLRVLCRGHNQHAANGYFGPEVVEARTEAKRKKRAANASTRHRGSATRPPSGGHVKAIEPVGMAARETVESSETELVESPEIELVEIPEPEIEPEIVDNPAPENVDNPEPEIVEVPETGIDESPEIEVDEKPGIEIESGQPSRLASTPAGWAPG